MLDELEIRPVDAKDEVALVHTVSCLHVSHRYYSDFSNDHDAWLGR
jgi:hypothetical protein